MAQACLGWANTAQWPPLSSRRLPAWWRCGSCRRPASPPSAPAPASSRSPSSTPSSPPSPPPTPRTPTCRSTSSAAAPTPSPTPPSSPTPPPTPTSWFLLPPRLLHADLILANSILLLHLRSTDPHPHRLARQLFDEMPTRTASTYNTSISYSPPGADVCTSFGPWSRTGTPLDQFTVSAVLPACGSAHRGRELHCFAIKSGMCGANDFHVVSGLMSMYCRVGRSGLAWRVFDGMKWRNVVSWTAMVGGYAENKLFEDVVEAFWAMWVVSGVMPNRFALISVLSAVEVLAGLVEGKQVHGFAVRMGLFGEVSLNNALIDMYAKCGMGAEAVALFDQMHASGVKPDIIVGLGVLSACCRAGLVLKGLEIYNSLVKDHGVHPSEEMSACIVDLLGRSGMIDHAFNFIKSMSVEPGPSVWGALLDAFVIHSNKEIQDLAHSSLLRLEEGNPSNLVLVSNLHASSGRWNIVEQVRTKIQQGSLKKTPGHSWVNPTT